VIWASDNYSWTEDGYTEYAYTYGNVVIVQHDFGFNGRRLYTLYAHLSLFLVSAGDRVRMGDVVGLSGRSGMVSGPHVHFEVRVGSNKYNATRNPILWMVPFEGHGVIAGRILAPNGQPIQDALVRLWQRKRVVDTTTTYVNPFWTDSQTYWNIVPDDVWRENFVFGDVPAGDYTLTVNVGNLDYEMQVTVRSATTSFVDFNLSQHEPTPSG
ncbi:MAG TPA: peptidoglycan DD-metalloendopeptidase family protein, partial [Aggregatilineales bacterium]|nr:peptidoglycan DD-metalloendopeptidase family protein [Aggregatilineales bacterium]